MKEDNRVLVCRCNTRDCVMVWEGPGDYSVQGLETGGYSWKGVFMWTRGGSHKLKRPRGVFCSFNYPYSVDKEMGDGG